jgi:hypothetical protein
MIYTYEIIYTNSSIFIKELKNNKDYHFHNIENILDMEDIDIILSLQKSKMRTRKWLKQNYPEFLI